MRLIKRQTTNLRSIAGKGVQYDINDQVVMDSTNTMLVPKGTTAQRPTSPVTGHIRYNTTTDQFEGYQNGAWRKFRYKEPNAVGIVQQNLGSGDANEVFFGPLESGDSDFPNPAAAQNVLVFVAHPDDETIGMGGTIKRHINSGDNVMYIVISFNTNCK